MTDDAAQGAGGGDLHGCWMCGGGGRSVIIENGARLTCPACGGTGRVRVMPRDTGEMVAMIAAMPEVPRRTLTPADHARIDEIEQIVIACLHEMQEEERQASGSSKSLD